MTSGKNNVLPNAHFHKKWEKNIRTWFDQPARKQRRRLKRAAKASKVAPRPVGLLRPVVRCQTVKYNTRQRFGRGFTLEELKEAGVTRKQALGIGISVDHRRKNRSLEGLQANVARLKTYKSKLIIFPRKNGKPKKGDSKPEELKTASQASLPLLPIEKTQRKQESRAITEDDKKRNVYRTLRQTQSSYRLRGVRAKKLHEKAEADKMLKKK
eukprot:NODE_1683_length_770_cov_126.286159_g1634_i0.p2 GENE.NODE_1683_length_770_cov_126.286159_g1634_i0~~NODE_1683_length_770_cov_126.286159_g1634_i0.p2  ORF type:complete len:212 (+),score=62.09 NODE_1683_length_770_cov_126.286159_g1634_i0:110-745(+)